MINGDTVTGPVDVELDDVTLTVDRPVALEVQADRRVVLVVDLNAASWLQAVDPTTATVDEQVFAALVSVGVR
ncbi:MAG: hypothetical protein O2956_08730 [Gemmatimonadetes bacterium]|nr:hypothetical protein [Gemmatimonadota bacterium]